MDILHTEHVNEMFFEGEVLADWKSRSKRSQKAELLPSPVGVGNQQAIFHVLIFHVQAIAPEAFNLEEPKDTKLSFSKRPDGGVTLLFAIRLLDACRLKAQQTLACPYGCRD